MAAGGPESNPDERRYDIVHTTTYRYTEPVRFGEHRVMFRPRESHDQRVLATDLQVSPESDIRLIQDPHSNSIDLEHYLRPHYDDPEGRLADWARGFLLVGPRTGTRNMLVRMNEAIRQGFGYAAPVSGSWFGEPGAYAGMDVSVTVTLRRT